MTPAPHGYDRTKRTADFVLATVGMLLTSPLQAAIALAIRHEMGSPVLFRQVRPGLHGQPFTLVKFRTMVEPDGQDALDDIDRLTPLGVWLRATSLDELPTLWNVMRGDMSLVGPRPLLMEYLDRYTPEQARRHQVRPGITGLAQVRGRNALLWEDKFSSDLEYVENCSLRLDLRIMVATVKLVLRREGISAPGDATMPYFMPERDTQQGLPE
jgi:lipopolysaccharide/colanic/teichoic acid biosynthesis glycosyltransferase